MGLILITHDLGVVADVADRIAVMYAGRIVEQADVYDLYAQPGAPVHQGSAGLDPAAGPEGPDARRDRRSAAEPDAHPARLPVQPALPLRAGRLPADPPPPLREVVHGTAAPPATSPSRCWPTARSSRSPRPRPRSRPRRAWSRVSRRATSAPTTERPRA